MPITLNSVEANFYQIHILLLIILNFALKKVHKMFYHS